MHSFDKSLPLPLRALPDADDAGRIISGPGSGSSGSGHGRSRGRSFPRARRLLALFEGDHAFFRQKFDRNLNEKRVVAAPEPGIKNPRQHDHQVHSRSGQAADCAQLPVPKGYAVVPVISPVHEVDRADHVADSNQKAAREADPKLFGHHSDAVAKSQFKT